MCIIWLKLTSRLFCHLRKFIYLPGFVVFLRLRIQPSSPPPNHPNNHLFRQPSNSPPPMSSAMIQSHGEWEGLYGTVGWFYMEKRSLGLEGRSSWFEWQNSIIFRGVGSRGRLPWFESCFHQLFSYETTGKLLDFSVPQPSQCKIGRIVIFNE